VCEAFGLDRSDQGLPVMDFAVCSVRPGPLWTSAGYSITAQYALNTAEGQDRVAAADLVAVPSLDRRRDFDPLLLDAVSGAFARGSRGTSVRAGAFALRAGRRLRRRRVHCAR